MYEYERRRDPEDDERGKLIKKKKQKQRTKRPVCNAKVKKKT